MRPHRTYAMISRLLLIGLLLSLGFNAYAASDFARGASRESGAPCPSTTAQTDPADAQAGTAAPLATPHADPAPAPRTGSNSAPLPRPGLRWHSFLPGMMK